MGVVGDRLRLKDATHIIANIAIPSTIRLVAEMRDQLLEAATPFAPQAVADAWQRVDVLCARSEEMSDTERLVLRVEHLRSILGWADALPNSPPFAAGDDASRHKLETALALAHKVLADRDDVNRVRLFIGERTVVGALVMGDQTWSRPLQRLITAGVDITPIRPQLLGDAHAAMTHLAKFYQEWEAAN